MLKKLNINIIFYTINIIIVLMDKKVIFERAEKKDNKELYLPDDEHIDFHVYANEAIKEKETYSYVNRDGYLVGKFISMMPNNAAKKVLRRIYMYTKILNPIFYIYNHNKHVLYKYIGRVEPIKSKKDKLVEMETENGIINIIKKNNYVVYQIEKKQY